MNNIITYYSYKGGVGRSMCLANTAVLLCKWGFKVLVVDWDLEAPGLELFFQDFIKVTNISGKKGIIDLLEKKGDWQDALVPVSIPESKFPIHLIHSGNKDEDYFKKVRNFNIDDFYSDSGGEFIERLREEWKKAFDFILIDSRTGITEIGGICAVQLPDQVVMLFTATDQGFDGTLDVAKRALKAQQNLPYDRQKLIFIPLLSRFDSQAEFLLSRDWVEHFAEGLSDIYKDWLPVSIKRADFLTITKIPYVTYFSFGEKLATLEQDVNDSSGLAHAYENVAAILANDVNEIQLLTLSRSEFINKAQRNTNLKRDGLKDQKKSANDLQVFISFSKRDSIEKSELSSYLSMLSIKYKVNFWSDDDLMPGDEWQKIIEAKLKESDIILLLVSENYMQSSFTMDEMETALRLKKRIVPIFLDKAEYQHTTINRLIGLPRDGRPISSFSDRQEGFSKVVDDLEILLKNQTTVRDIYKYP